eukprot:4420803-Karenia_brevis.AAC.1
MCIRDRKRSSARLLLQAAKGVATPTLNYHLEAAKHLLEAHHGSSPPMAWGRGGGRTWSQPRRWGNNNKYNNNNNVYNNNRQGKYWEINNQNN